MSSTIHYSRHGSVIEEVYFDATSHVSTPSRVDLLRLTELATPVPSATTAPFSTRVIDLRAAEGELLSSLQGNTRTKIRRAMRDGVRTRARSVADLPAFLSFFSAFARQKQLHAANEPKLAALASAGLLVLTSAERPDGTPMAWHAYIAAVTRARQLYSATSLSGQSDGQAIGRSHRLLQWFDITHLKQLGLQELDLGGWYPGNKDPARMRINDFKQEFGGAVVQRYTCWRGLSLKGRLAVLILKAAQALQDSDGSER
ncbi:MAG TPA: GNAT family N-acetyltransferase [Bryobacteraceae bacterium]|nr:GNAT family N-acetyltransferase [Bryobacteraceae bacterium]